VEKTGDITQNTPVVSDLQRSKCAGECNEQIAKDIDQEDIACNMASAVEKQSAVKCCGSAKCKNANK